VLLLANTLILPLLNSCYQKHHAALLIGLRLQATHGQPGYKPLNVGCMPKIDLKQKE